MPIPDFQQIFLPLLKLAGDGEPHSNKDAVDALADVFNLSLEEREEVLPSGRQAIFTNRTYWAKTYLKKAGLLTQPARAVFQITEKGKSVLQNPPPVLNVSYLKQFEEFLEFHTAKSATNDDTKKEKENIEYKTPEELMALGYKDLRLTLVSELLSSVMQMSPSFFEQLVVDLLLQMGYGEAGGSRAGIAIGKSGDEGIDGTISEDKLGLDLIYIQAKRWEGSVGRPEIQKFVGALQGKRAKKGVFITTSNFTAEAKKYSSMVDTRVILVDGQRLANLMIDHNVGVALKESYEIKKIDSDYFIEE